MGVPKIWANGFILAQTASDMSVVFLTNNTPSTVLSMSYVSAKTLRNELTKLIESFEKLTGQTVSTIEENTQKIQKAQEK
jgi:hypothetical protein